MKIPKEIREKIEQKIKLDEEIKDWMKESIDVDDRPLANEDLNSGRVYPAGGLPRRPCAGHLGRDTCHPRHVRVMSPEKQGELQTGSS